MNTGRALTVGLAGTLADTVDRLAVEQPERARAEVDLWPNDDEFFFCLDGNFIVDLEDRTVTLAPLHGFTVPKGIVHRTRAPERCVILMIENAGIVPTGD